MPREPEKDDLSIRDLLHLPFCYRRVHVERIASREVENALLISNRKYKARVNASRPPQPISKIVVPEPSNEL